MRFRILRFGLTVGVATLFTTAGWAQFSNLHLSATRDRGRPGDMAETRVWADTSDFGVTQGWSLGLCHDPNVAQVTEVLLGATTATIHGGDPVDFLLVDLYPEGWTAGAVVDFTSGFNLPRSGNLELHVARYELIGSDGDATLLEFCDTLGTPSVVTVFPAGGASVAPTTHSGLLEIVDSPFVFRAPIERLIYSAAGTTNVSVTLTAEQYDPPFIETQGLAISIAYRTDVMQAIEISPAGPVAELDGGPGFFSLVEYPEGIAGGIVYDLIGAEMIVLGGETDVVHVELQVDVPDLLGETYELRWVDGIGAPFSVNVVVGSGTSFQPVLRDGLLALEYQEQIQFIRGDCDLSGGIGIGDAIEVLQFLFSGLAVTCQDACDVNGDGIVNVADGIYSLDYSFLMGPPPPAPFPSCGEASLLGCDQSGCP